MTASNEKPQRPVAMTRRAMIGATFGTAVGLGCARATQAEEKPAAPPGAKPEEKPEEIEGHFNHKYKVSQASVNYYDKGVPGAQICAGCHYYIDPTECLVVEGYVSPYGWCDFYND